MRKKKLILEQDEEILFGGMCLVSLFQFIYNCLFPKAIQINFRNIKKNIVY